MALGKRLVAGAVPPPAQVLLLVPMMLGVALASAGEISLTWAGLLTCADFLVALSFTLCFAGRGVLSKQLTSGGTGRARPCARPGSSTAGEVIPPPPRPPSCGSAKHGAGRCVPCRFNFAGMVCKHGYACLYCHMHTTEEYKRKKTLAHRLAAARRCTRRTWSPPPAARASAASPFDSSAGSGEGGTAEPGSSGHAFFAPRLGGHSIDAPTLMGGGVHGG